MIAITNWHLLTEGDVPDEVEEVEALGAPLPAHATEYVACANVAQDANTLYNLMQVAPVEEGASLIAEMRKTKYGKVVVDVAVAAAKSGDVKEYIRKWHTTCLKLTT